MPGRTNRTGPQDTGTIQGRIWEVRVEGVRGTSTGVDRKVFH